MPKAPKSKRAPASSIQALVSQGSRTARPTTSSNQQNIMPRPPMQSRPAGHALPAAVPPMSAGGMQYPVAAAAPPGSEPPPALPLSTDPPKPQPTNRDFRVWSLISGMLNVDDQGKPTRSLENVVHNIGCYIYEPVKKMPAPDAEAEKTRRAGWVSENIFAISAVGSCTNTVQVVQLTQLVGFLLNSGCVTPETLGKAISRTWLAYQQKERTDLARKLWGFVTQIHGVHHGLLGIPKICQPRSVHNLPMWVDLLIPHENDTPEAKAKREACVVSPDVGKVMIEAAEKAAWPPHPPLPQNSAPTNVAYPRMMQMQRPVPSTVPSQQHSRPQLQPQPQPQPSHPQTPMANRATGRGGRVRQPSAMNQSS